VQTVDISKHDWKKEPYRYDPSRGYFLCRHCWDGQHFEPAYRDKNGTTHPRKALCAMGQCGCGCRPEFKATRKPKFTGEGQQKLPDAGVIFVGPHADELRQQVEISNARKR
jgi:hypothetical protein